MTPYVRAVAVAGSAVVMSMAPTAVATPALAGTAADAGQPCAYALVSYAGTTWCPVPLSDVARARAPAGQRLSVGGGVVDGVAGSTVSVYGWEPCPADRYCGAGTVSLTVTFEAGGAVPAYGDTVTLYGQVVGSRFVPVGFQVTGHCNPEFGDC